MALFGKRLRNKSVSHALTMCILDEIEDEDRIMRNRDEILAGLQRDIARGKIEEKALKEITDSANAITDICEQLQKASRISPIDLDLYMDAHHFGTYLLYSIVNGTTASASKKEEAFDRATTFCPLHWCQNVKQIFDKIQHRDELGKLILSMEKFPLIILDLAHKTQNHDLGSRFLNETATFITSVGKFLDARYPYDGYTLSAQRVGIKCMDDLLETINES